MKNYFVYLLIIVLSCDNGHDTENYKVITSDSIEQYSVELIELEGVNFGPKEKFGLLTEISLANSTIVVKDDKKEYAFFAIKNGDGLIPFQPVGDGPNRVEKPEYIKMVSYDESANEMYFFNYLAKSLSSIKVQPDAGFNEFSKIPGAYWGEIQGAVNLNDSLVAITGLFPDTKYAVFNRHNGTELVRSDYANSFAVDLPEAARIASAPTDILYNKKQNMLFVYSSSVNSIDAYSVDGELRKFYVFSDLENLSTENVFSRNFFYYYSVKTQEDILYGLYLGKERTAIAMQEFFLTHARPELHVFNLLTDELQRFGLDRVVNACVVDSGRKLVYCIEEDNEDQPLVKYEIP